MSNIEIESRVAKAVLLTIAALDRSVSRAEEIARIRTALALLSGIAED